MSRALLAILLALIGAPLSAAPAAADTGPWGWPLAGPHAVSRDFAPPTSAYGAGHRGVDLPAAPGAAVRAAGAGRVTYAGLLAGRGVVVVRHGALRSTYEPVTASVQVGQWVALGETVGTLDAGHLGCAAAACLHWGLRRGEAYLDPVRLVERGPVRLLPVEGPPGRALPATALPARAGAPAAASLLDPDDPPAPATSEVRAPGVDARQPAAVTEPRWSLRADETPLGMAAVAALVLGIGLLARPRPVPPDPVSGGAAGRAASPDVPEEQVRPAAQLLDLDSARLRRSAAS